MDGDISCSDNSRWFGGNKRVTGCRAVGSRAERAEKITPTETVRGAQSSGLRDGLQEMKRSAYQHLATATETRGAPSDGHTAAHIGGLVT